MLESISRSLLVLMDVSEMFWLQRMYHCGPLVFNQSMEVFCFRNRPFSELKELYRVITLLISSFPH
jgi:hypothetical protein